MDMVNLGLSILSMLIGGFLGWKLSTSRGRNPVGWMVAGIIFPPLVLILLFLKPSDSEPQPRTEDDEAA